MGETCLCLASPHCVVDGSHMMTVTPEAQGLSDVGQVDGVGIHGHHTPVQGGYGEAEHSNVRPDV